MRIICQYADRRISGLHAVKRISLINTPRRIKHVDRRPLRQLQAAPFGVRVRLDDDKLAASLPAGSTGAAAIYTEHIKAAHIIRKVLLRQTAILNYVIPF